MVIIIQKLRSLHYLKKSNICLIDHFQDWLILNEVFKKPHQFIVDNCLKFLENIIGNPFSPSTLLILAWFFFFFAHQERAFQLGEVNNLFLFEKFRSFEFKVGLALRSKLNMKMWGENLLISTWYITQALLCWIPKIKFRL